MLSRDKKSWLFKHTLGCDEWCEDKDIFTRSAEAQLARVKLFKRLHGLKAANEGYAKKVRQLLKECNRRGHLHDYGEAPLIFQYPVSQRIVVCTMALGGCTKWDVYSALDSVGVKARVKKQLDGFSLWWPYDTAIYCIEWSSLARYLVNSSR